jgi:hypothetical protein
VNDFGAKSAKAPFGLGEDMLNRWIDIHGIPSRVDAEAQSNDAPGSRHIVGFRFGKRGGILFVRPRDGRENRGSIRGTAGDRSYMIQACGELERT